MTTTVSIEHERDGNDVVSHAAFRILETFAGPAANADDPILEDIKRKTARALEHYPELAGKTVTVGRLDPDEDVNGRATFFNLMTFYPVDRITSFLTVYHELAHLAIHIRNQRGDDVPITSEEYCSLLAITRMPTDRLDRNHIAYFGKPTAPRNEWPDICQRALNYRDEHGANSHYIKRANEWLGTTDQ